MQQCSAQRARELSNCCTERFLASDHNPVDYQVWAAMHRRVYQTDIHNVDELKQRLIHFWYTVDQNVINTAIDQWCKRL